MASTPLLLSGDVQVVERRQDVRIVLSVPGRFMLASRRRMEGERREFPCRIINVSTHAVALATPVAAEIGERAIVHVDQFGKLEGRIVRLFTGGFLVEISATKAERIKLAAKIQWYEKHKNHDAKNQRKNGRTVPKDPCSTLIFADGTTTECLVKDVSASGVAVSADFIPEIGTPVAVGQVVGRVVRKFKDGFAVHFTEKQDPQAVERLIAKIS
jgi:hypothetical protein